MPAESPRTPNSPAAQSPQEVDPFGFDVLAAAAEGVRQENEAAQQLSVPEGWGDHETPWGAVSPSSPNSVSDASASEATEQTVFNPERRSIPVETREDVGHKALYASGVQESGEFLGPWDHFVETQPPAPKVEIQPMSPAEEQAYLDAMARGIASDEANRTRPYTWSTIEPDNSRANPPGVEPPQQ